MPTLFMYIVASSSNPDQVECVVPYQVNDNLIFFGPCKKRLRERLRNQYLKTSDDFQPNEDIFIVGVNGSNPHRIRKIVWAGHLKRLMTFETAYNTLTTPEFQAMRSHKFSPIHLKPLYNQADKFLGYQHNSLEHENCWVLDIVSANNHPLIQVNAKQLLLHPDANRHQVFVRDCCFLCDNIFFADGAGFAITDEVLEVLRQAQPTNKIDSYALFGYRANGSAEGLTGSYLEIPGQLANDLISLIKTSSPKSLSKSRKTLKPCRCR